MATRFFQNQAEPPLNFQLWVGHPPGQVDPEFWLERSAKASFLYAIEELANRELKDKSPGEWSDLAIAHQDRWLIQRLASFWEHKWQHGDPPDELDDDWGKYYALSMIAGDLGCDSCREDAQRFLSNRDNTHYQHLDDGVSERERIASQLPQYRSMLAEPASQSCPYFEPLSMDQLAKLLSSGVSPTRVLTILRQRGVSFDPSIDSLNTIRHAGGNDEVIISSVTERRALGCSDIALLLQAGVSQKVLAQTVRQRSTNCSLTPTESQDLRSAGASNDLMLAILQHH